MREKPFSSYSKLQERKSKIKINGASISGLGPGSCSSIRVCDLCGKQFNSGKALGGHRRHHIQAQRKMKEQQEENVSFTLRIKTKNLVIRHNHNNNLMKSKIGNLNCSSGICFRCLVCDKDFPSEKSLCGHMRNHPDIDWTGLNPPFTSTTDNALASSASSSSEEFMREQDHENHFKSNNNGSSSSTSDESLSVPVDVSSSCSESSWLKKDMRGRKSIGEAEAAHIAAQTLMDMHLYGHSQLRAGLPPREPTPEAAQLPVKKRKNNVMNNNVGGSSSSPAGKQSLDNCKEKLEGSDRNEELEAENNMWDMKVIDLIKGKKKLNMKKRKLGTEMIKSEGEPLMIRTVKQEVKPSQSYVCDICNKSFPCFQALGGHKTKHRQNIVKSTKGKEVVQQRQEHEKEEEEEEDKVCINGTSLSSAGLSGEEEEVGEASQQSGSKIRGFDLNVPYV